jgi:hypothetical protein
MCVASSSLANIALDAEVPILMPLLLTGTTAYNAFKTTILPPDFERFNADWREFTLNGEFQQRK